MNVERTTDRAVIDGVIFNGYGGWELFVDFCGIILFIVKRK